MYATVVGEGQPQKIRKNGEYFGKATNGTPANLCGFHSGIRPARISFAAYSIDGILNMTRSDSMLLCGPGLAPFADAGMSHPFPARISSGNKTLLPVNEGP